MAYNTFTPIVTNGLIFCLDPINAKSYDGSGTSSYDIKSLQVGELMNGVGFVGGVFTFDGVDDVIDFGSGGVAQQLRGSSEFTVSSWVRKTGSTSSALISAYDGSATEGWFLQWYLDGNIYCGVRNLSGTGYNYTPLTWVDDWFNLTLVYDGGQSLDIDRAYIFVNGVTVSMVNSGTVESSLSTTAINFLVGAAVNYPGGNADGKCSSVMIYNRKLLADEILQNYNALKNRFII